MSGDQYVCTLSASTLQKAREELNENPADRMAAVSALREWILQQPHLRCSTGETERPAYFTQLLVVHVRHHYSKKKVLTITRVNVHRDGDAACISPLSQVQSATSEEDDH